MSLGITIIVKKFCIRKSFHLFIEVFDVKKKTTGLRVGAAESKLKAIIAGSMLWSSITKRKVNTKINEQVNKCLYNWILQHPQILQYPITNDFVKVSIDGHYEPQVLTDLLLQVSVWELHNSMVSPQEEGGLKEAIFAENNIIISDSTLQSFLTPQFNNMSAQ